MLLLVMTARAGDPAPVVQIYDVADLKADEAWWAAAMARVRAAAAGAPVRAEGDTLVITAPAAAHEGIAKALSEVRDSFRVLVTLETRLVRIEGGFGGTSVPAAEIDAFLKEKRAASLGRQALTTWNGQPGSLKTVRQVSYVSDFEVSVTAQGAVVADPTVSTFEDGVSVELRPFATPQAVRVAVRATLTEVKEPMAEVELPLPLVPPVKIQVPDVTSRSVSRLVECKPGAYSVIDLGGDRFLFLMAIPASADRVAGGK